MRTRQHHDRYVRPKTLAELRHIAGLKQAEVAQRLGIQVPSVSRAERKPNLHTDTLADFVEALGGRLVIAADFSDPKGRTVRHLVRVGEVGDTLIDLHSSSAG